MKLGYELVLEQTQKLVMTPELIQAIKILQFTAQELDVYVADQLMANPVLELDDRSPAEKEAEQDQTLQNNVPEDHRECDLGKDDRFDWAEHIREREYDDISYRQFQTEAPVQDYSYEQYVSGDVSLNEYLMTQMQFICLTTECCRVAKLIIEALDENGYLTVDAEQVAVQLLGDSIYTNPCGPGDDRRSLAGRPEPGPAGGGRQGPQGMPVHPAAAMRPG